MCGQPERSCQRDKGGGGRPCGVGMVQLRTHGHAKGAAAREGHRPGSELAAPGQHVCSGGTAAGREGGGC